MGSGTFLIEGAAQLNSVGLRRFWERLTGFDISAQAIGVAQINLYLAVLAHLDREQAEEVGTLQLYPTDALDPQNGTKLRSVMPLLTDESTRNFLRRRIELSEKVKQESHFPLVIGNPPYRNNSDQTLAQVADKFPRLLRSSRANARARARNIRDDYAWFFAAADHYVSDRGVIAFVVSDSFCYAQSYRYFREDLLRRYRIRHLINLGSGIFRDVGPRTQFVIIALERREGELTRADDSEAIDYVDLRPLETAHQEAMVDVDPRLTALESGDLPKSLQYQPTRERQFHFFPASAVVPRVNEMPVVLYGDSPQRVFLTKWPGLITAFDKLFRGETRSDVERNLQTFFAAAVKSDKQRASALDEFSETIRVTSDKEKGRLSLMANLTRDLGLTFEADRVRRVISGSAPDDAAWFPDSRQVSWIYYEPRLAVPRNVNDGRNPGWGTMSQWREPESHRISPKFVFTTSTNPRFGLKAFVVPGDWMVKAHGAESQQFHYTGVTNPLRPLSLTGPNNLGAEASNFYEALGKYSQSIERLWGEEDFLLYLAAIYNAQVTHDYVEGGGGSVMRIPLDMRSIDIRAVRRIVDLAKEQRNLHWLVAEALEADVLDASLCETLVPVERLRALGLEEIRSSGGRFVQRRRWRVDAAAQATIRKRIAQLREQLDEDVDELYG